MENQNKTLEDVQKEVDELLSDPNLSVKYFPPFELVNQMTEELGEIAREVAHLYGHKKKKKGEKTEGLKAEIGDLLFAIICLANSEGVSIQEAYDMKIKKFEDRDQERFRKDK